MKTSRSFQASMGGRGVRSNPTAHLRRRTHVVALAAGLAVIGGACASGASADSADTTATVRAPLATDKTSVPAAAQTDIAGTFDIGGRKMYMQCTGQGSPTVILISGGGIAADAWDSPLGEQPTVYPTIAKTARVCAYDRPGTTRARAEGGISRSDPVPQPVTPSRSVAELHALLRATGQAGPFVLAAHSYGGLVARLFAHQYPTEVAGMVLVDSFSPELREAMPDLWPSWIAWNTTPAAILEDYPDYERVDFDKALDEIVANRSIPSMPLVVLTADKPYPAPTQPGLPADINVVTREAQDVSQRQVALLAPGAEHITKTDSGHDIMLENPVLVSDAILDVIAAARDGRTTIG
jgi:pimeloyl-ACP methyl ester carboxylesterase